MSERNPTQRNNRNNRNGNVVRKAKRDTKQLEQHIIDMLLHNKIPKSLRGASPYPDSQDVNHSVSLTFVLNAGAATFAVAEFTTNDLVDPLAALGAVNVTGFAAMADIYDSFVVRSFSLDFSLSSLETTLPISFGFLMRDSQPSVALATYAQALAALAVSPTTGIQTLGVLSGSSIYRNRTRYTIRNDAIIGNTFRYYGNPSFGGSSVTSPTDRLWCAVVLLSPNATFLTNGAVVTINLIYHAHWFSKKPVVA